MGLVLTIGLFSSLLLAAGYGAPAQRPARVDHTGEAEFRQEIQPLLKKYCYPCHAGSVKSGNVAFDEIKPGATPDRID